MEERKAVAMRFQLGVQKSRQQWRSASSLHREEGLHQRKKDNLQTVKTRHISKGETEREKKKLGPFSHNSKEQSDSVMEVCCRLY